jgi:hypothetical protein
MKALCGLRFQQSVSARIMLRKLFVGVCLSPAIQELPRMRSVSYRDIAIGMSLSDAEIAHLEDVRHTVPTLPSAARATSGGSR